MWFQYDPATGIIHAATDSRVDDLVLAGVGRAQIEGEGDILALRVDVTADPPALAAAEPAA